MPVGVIASYRAWSDGRNRRPRDANSGSSFNVFLEPRGEPTGARNPNYLVPVYYFPRFFARSRMRFAGSRPVVYIAKGTHAAYPTPGRWHTLGSDRTADGGRSWDTYRNLQSLAAQPWKHFAGAWGEVGLRATTTGPLGPWHKRFRP